jgi:predicted 3-demethylubiquinone-9 3-methyltransferase (glyoxalase superfamily)
MQLSTHLMFQGALTEALALYRAALPALQIRILAEAEGRVIQAEAQLGDHRLTFFDSPPVHAFTFTPSVSLFLTCGTADEVDRLAATLGKGGGTLMPPGAYDFAPRFAWVTDAFGVSWQIMQAPAR